MPTAFALLFMAMALSANDLFNACQTIHCVIFSSLSAGGNGETEIQEPHSGKYGNSTKISEYCNVTVAYMT